MFLEVDKVYRVLKGPLAATTDKTHQTVHNTEIPEGTCVQVLSYVKVYFISSVATCYELLTVNGVVYRQANKEFDKMFYEQV